MDDMTLRADAIVAKLENHPRAYDLKDQHEVRRLIREVHGYLRTCIKEHHGTDRAGREFAASALYELMVTDRKEWR